MADKKSKGSLFWPRWLFGVRRKPQVTEPPPTTEAETTQTQEQAANKKKKGLQCLPKLLELLFSVLIVVTAVVALALIAVSTLSAVVASGLDTQDDSGRLVALVVLAVTAAVTVAAIVYAQVATCTKKIRPIFVAAVVLLVLAVIQAIISTSVQVSEKEQNHITQGLAESFQLAKQHSPRHVKMWASTQHSLNCCGLFSPFDYRPPNSLPYMPPDVPVSCCPGYDPDRSDLVQEKEREYCKVKNEYFQTGCNSGVLEVIKESSLWVFTVAVVLIVLEVLSAATAAFVVKKRKDAAPKDKSNQDDDREAQAK